MPFHSVYNLSSSQIIKNSKKYKEEYKRTMDSDLSFPIDIMHNNGRWLILDGLHRLIKVNILGMKKVKVRKIPRSEIPNILKEIKTEKDFEI
ncbi:MAG: ParB N-terminal domain-containing protein [Nanoarchaeota archaeon]